MGAKMQPWKLSLCVILLFLCGCQKLNLLRSQSPDKEKDEEEEVDAEPKTELIGDFATIAGNNVVTVYGIGLVTGLENTGEDPPPSMYRTKIAEEMKRRGVKGANQILQSPT